MTSQISLFLSPFFFRQVRNLKFNFNLYSQALYSGSASVDCESNQTQTSGSDDIQNEELTSETRMLNAKFEVRPLNSFCLLR